MRDFLSIFRVIRFCGFFAGCLLFCAVRSQAAPEAGTVRAGFEKANQAYSRGDFKAAREAYTALVKTGARSANLFYNLANTDYRLGEKGPAILNYERALALEPGHPEAGANLALLRGETGARIANPADLPLWQRALEWPREFAGRWVAWIAAAAFWIAVFSFAPLPGRRRVAIAWLPAVLGLAVLAWAGGAVAWEASRGAEWIVTGSAVKAKTAPADSSKPTGTLPPGSEVRLLLESGEWLYVLLPDHSRGWIARSEAEPLALDLPAPGGA